MKMATKGDRNM